jgi:hypothetical protein
MDRGVMPTTFLNLPQCSCRRVKRKIMPANREPVLASCPYTLHVFLSNWLGGGGGAGGENNHWHAAEPENTGTSITACTEVFS